MRAVGDGATSGAGASFFSTVFLAVFAGFLSADAADFAAFFFGSLESVSSFFRVTISGVLLTSTPPHGWELITLNQRVYNAFTKLGCCGVIPVFGPAVREIWLVASSHVRETTLGPVSHTLTQFLGLGVIISR